MQQFGCFGATFWGLLGYKGRIIMQKDSLKLKTKEIPFSLESVGAKKVSMNGELNNWNLHEDCGYQPRQEDSTDSQNIIKMVPCPPCVWG
jgi:hypothetical protein